MPPPSYAARVEGTKLVAPVLEKLRSELRQLGIATQSGRDHGLTDTLAHSNRSDTRVHQLIYDGKFGLQDPLAPDQAMAAQVDLDVPELEVLVSLEDRESFESGVLKRLIADYGFILQDGGSTVSERSAYLQYRFTRSEVRNEPTVLLRKNGAKVPIETARKVFRAIAALQKAQSEENTALERLADFLDEHPFTKSAIASYHNRETLLAAIKVLKGSAFVTPDGQVPEDVQAVIRSTFDFVPIAEMFVRDPVKDGFGPYYRASQLLFDRGPHEQITVSLNPKKIAGPSFQGVAMLSTHPEAEQFLATLSERGVTHIYTARFPKEMTEELDSNGGPQKIEILSVLRDHRGGNDYLLILNSEGIPLVLSKNGLLFDIYSGIIETLISTPDTPVINGNRLVTMSDISDAIPLPKPSARSEVREGDYFDNRAVEIAAYADQNKGDLPADRLDIIREHRLEDIEFVLSKLTLEQKQELWGLSLDFLRRMAALNQKIMITIPAAGLAARMGKGFLAPFFIASMHQSPDKFVNTEKLNDDDWKVIDGEFKGDWKAYVRSLTVAFKEVEEKGKKELIPATPQDMANHKVLDRLFHEDRALLPADDETQLTEVTFLNAKIANDFLESLGLGRMVVVSVMKNEKFYPNFVRYALLNSAKLGVKMHFIDTRTGREVLPNIQQLESLDERELQKYLQHIDIDHNALDNEILVYNQPLKPVTGAPRSVVESMWRDDLAKTEKAEKILAAIASNHEPNQPAVSLNEERKTKLQNESDELLKSRYFVGNQAAYEYALKRSDELGGKAIRDPKAMRPAGHSWTHLSRFMSGVGTRQEPLLISMIRRKIALDLLHNADNGALFDEYFMLILGKMLKEGSLVALEDSLKPPTERGSGGGANVWIRDPNGKHQIHPIDDQGKPLPHTVPATLRQAEFALIKDSTAVNRATGKSFSQLYNAKGEAVRNNKDMLVNNATVTAFMPILDDTGGHLTGRDAYSALVGKDALEAAIQAGLQGDYNALEKLAPIMQSRMTRFVSKKAVKDPFIKNPGPNDLIAVIPEEGVAWDVQLGDGVLENLLVALTSSVADYQAGNATALESRFNPVKDRGYGAYKAGVDSKREQVAGIKAGRIFSQEFRAFAERFLKRSEVRAEFDPPIFTSASERLFADGGIAPSSTAVKPALMQILRSVLTGPDYVRVEKILKAVPENEAIHVYMADENLTPEDPSFETHRLVNVYFWHDGKHYEISFIHAGNFDAKVSDKSVSISVSDQTINLKVKVGSDRRSVKILSAEKQGILKELHELRETLNYGEQQLQRLRDRDAYDQARLVRERAESILSQHPDSDQMEREYQDALEIESGLSHTMGQRMTDEEIASTLGLLRSGQAKAAELLQESSPDSPSNSEALLLKTAFAQLISEFQNRSGATRSEVRRPDEMLHVESLLAQGERYIIFNRGKPVHQLDFRAGAASDNAWALDYENVRGGLFDVWSASAYDHSLILDKVFTEIAPQNAATLKQTFETKYGFLSGFFFQPEKNGDWYLIGNSGAAGTEGVVVVHLNTLESLGGASFVSTRSRSMILKGNQLSIRLEGHKPASITLSAPARSELRNQGVWDSTQGKFVEGLTARSDGTVWDSRTGTTVPDIKAEQDKRGQVSLWDNRLGEFVTGNQLRRRRSETRNVSVPVSEFASAQAPERITTTQPNRLTSTRVNSSGLNIATGRIEAANVKPRFITSSPALVSAPGYHSFNLPETLFPAIDLSDRLKAQSVLGSTEIRDAVLIAPEIWKDWLPAVDIIFGAKDTPLVAIATSPQDIRALEAYNLSRPKLRTQILIASDVKDAIVKVKTWIETHGKKWEPSRILALVGGENEALKAAYIQALGGEGNLIPATPGMFTRAVSELGITQLLERFRSELRMAESA